MLVESAEEAYAIAFPSPYSRYQLPRSSSIFPGRRRIIGRGESIESVLSERFERAGELSRETCKPDSSGEDGGERSEEAGWSFDNVVLGVE